MVVIVLFFIPRIRTSRPRFIAGCTKAVDGSAEFHTVKAEFHTVTANMLQLAALHAFPLAQQWQMITFIRSGRPSAGFRTRHTGHVLRGLHKKEPPQK